MVLPQSQHAATPVLITPECEAPGCHVSGDQYTMVRCRNCSAWFCSEHVAAEAGVTLIHPASRVLRSLAYYEGTCLACQQERQHTRH